ncbi:MAG: hypothetical protein ACFFDF_24890 [Candidatus Odinarchaeota archaeon]
MKQLKFDKNGFILPQKINYDIKHEEETEEAIKEIELEKELLRGLNLLATEDRDIKSLVIWCNPNYCYGPDYLVQEKIEKILEKLIDENLVVQEKSPQDRDVFSIDNKKNIPKKGV